ncbi:MAG: hypothetical protein KatS3mg008_0978 [Acidimicrobiales bacterium]|nr:MAG: hypothetical protein KatS3mg008_0978 [Acidimicrobiales bacterium]
MVVRFAAERRRGGATARTWSACLVASLLVSMSCGGGEAARRRDDSPTTTQASADPSPGCRGQGDGFPAQREQRHTVEVGGTPREFLLTVPEVQANQEPLPLLLDFHGLAEGSVVHARMSGFSDLAERERFVVAFPQGTGTPVRWNANVASRPNQDLLFFDALVREISSGACIDLSRIYAAGLSNGAMFASLLACLRPSVVAAVAAVAGIIHPEGCRPDPPVGVVAFHGTADRILRFNGGVDLSGIPGLGTGESTSSTTLAVDLDGPGIPQAVAAFARDYGCADEPEDRRFSDEVLVREWNCPGRTRVTFYVIEGGGHAWPGSEASRAIESIVGHTTFDVDASAEAWRFLEGHARR